MAPNILSREEVELLVNAPKISGLLGIRDRAIFETLSATGLRAQEFIHLRVYDLDPRRGTLLVRQDKAGRDHTLLLGASALFWIETYLRETRSLLAAATTAAAAVHDNALFLTRRGRPFTTRELNQLVRHYLAAVEIKKQGGCHLFRRSRAVHLL
jgi:integrase/recombinase XerD